MGLINIAGQLAKDTAKNLTGAGVDLAIAPIKFGAEGLAGAWKLAFGQETGDLVDLPAKAINQLADGAGYVAKTGVNGAVDIAAEATHGLPAMVKKAGEIGLS